MPGRLTWSEYITFAFVAFSSMFLGATFVHRIYKPNLTIPDDPPSLEGKESKLIGIKKRPS
uniref:Uncharacterized protein n=1 Tax=Amphimedon queenslandica TaxID=400682 RepID=A0A1X7VS58_AMPQE